MDVDSRRLTMELGITETLALLGLFAVGGLGIFRSVTGDDPLFLFASAVAFGILFFGVQVRARS